MRGTVNFAKGFVAGALISGAVCMMVDPPSHAKIKKAYKKTNRAMKTVGCAIEDLVMNR